MNGSQTARISRGTRRESTISSQALDRETAAVDLPLAVLSAVRSVIGDGPAALHEPSLAGNEWNYLKECLDSGFVSSVGPFVERFESELARQTGAQYAVAVVNGTAALHVALLITGIQPNDEVLVPAVTFVATANAVRYCGAIPHFVDVDPERLGLDPLRLATHLSEISERSGGRTINKRTGRTLRAVVPMHALGHPVAMDELLAVAANYDLIVVEDAAESLGSTYRGRSTGTLGDIGIVSFNGNKTITTGGGGALLTNNPHLARRARHITTTARVPHRWAFEHDEVAYNYRMPNVNAALGCAQLERLPVILDAKRRLHARYSEAFSAVPNVRLLTEPVECRSNYWLQAILLDADVAEQRDNVLDVTNGAGIGTRPLWRSMHRLDIFADCPRAAVPVAEDLERRTVNIPSSAFLA